MIKASIELYAPGMPSMEEAEAELNRQARQWFGLSFEARTRDYEIVIVSIEPDTEVRTIEGRRIHSTWDVKAIAGTKDVLRREGHVE